MEITDHLLFCWSQVRMVQMAICNCAKGALLHRARWSMSVRIFSLLSWIVCITSPATPLPSLGAYARTTQTFDQFSYFVADCAFALTTAWSKNVLLVALSRYPCIFWSAWVNNQNACITLCVHQHLWPISCWPPSAGLEHRGHLGTPTAIASQPSSPSPVMRYIWLLFLRSVCWLAAKEKMKKEEEEEGGKKMKRTHLFQPAWLLISAGMVSSPKQKQLPHGSATHRQSQYAGLHVERPEQPSVCTQTQVG